MRSWRWCRFCCVACFRRRFSWQPAGSFYCLSRCLCLCDVTSTWLVSLNTPRRTTSREKHERWPPCWRTGTAANRTRRGATIWSFNRDYLSRVLTGRVRQGQPSVLDCHRREDPVPGSEHRAVQRCGRLQVCAGSLPRGAPAQVCVGGGERVGGICISHGCV